MVNPQSPPGPTGAANGRVNAQFFKADVFTFLSSLTKVYGDTVRFDIGHTPCALVNGAADVDTLLRKFESHLSKPDFLSASNRGHWGDGLTTLEANNWQERRKLLTPQFRTRAFAPRLDIFAECSEDMMARWAPGQTVDLTCEVRLLSARIAARTVLDADIEGWGDPHARAGLLPYEEAFGEDFAISTSDDEGGLLQMTRPRAPRDMGVTTTLIRNRIESGPSGPDVLSDVIKTSRQAGVPIDPDAMIGELVQMLYAGHLTIPNSMTAFWSCLAADSLIEQQVMAEADDLLSREQMIAPAELLRSVTMAALKEAMRLHPPAPLLYRKVRTPFELGGFSFSQDVQVWVSPRLLHRDPRNFDDPDAFRPDRFAYGQSAKPVRSAYLPFGGGPRTCIAMNQSFHQMTLIALHIARRFSLKPIKSTPGYATVQARDQSGISLESQSLPKS